MELTPEERQRIYEEEAARHAARKEIEAQEFDEDEQAAALEQLKRDHSMAVWEFWIAIIVLCFVAYFTVKAMGCN